MQSVSRWIDIDRRTEDEVRGLAFGARMDALRGMATSGRGPGGRERLGEISAFWRRRGWWPEAEGLGHAELDPPGFATDPRTLFVRFLCYGDTWPRARQSLAYERLGGAGGDRRVAVWYAMFPYVATRDLAGLAAVGAIARRFPDRWEPDLVRFALARRLYVRWAISGAPRRGGISLALHREILADVDAAYRITTAKFGPDRPWNALYRSDLDLWRHRTGAQDR